MDDIGRRASAGPRYFHLLLTGFGALALVLGSIGVYGLMSYAVNERAYEFGIRAALGASRQSIMKQAVRDAFARHEVQTLVADYTNKSDEITRVLRLFGRAGVPMYLIFPSGRADEPILLPELLTPSMVISRLDEAAQTRRIASQ